jgi:hypothetical protein
MNAAGCALAFLAVIAVGAPASGKTLTDEKLGVTMEVPDDWADSVDIANTARAPAELIAGIASPDGARTFIAMAVPLNPREAGSPESYQQGLQGSLKTQGFALGATTRMTVNGVNFESCTATVAGESVPRMQVLSAFGNGRAFTLSASSGLGDPTHDPELQAMVQSFRFLIPPKPLRSVSPASAASQRFGMLAGGAIMVAGLVACPAALIIGGYFFFRKKK